MHHKRANVCVARVCARVFACACSRVRVCLGAPASAPNRVRTFRRRRPRAARLAGVLLRLGVQREYRLVEHCSCHQIVQGMCHFRPAARHHGGRARPVFDAALPMRARCCARTHVWALGRAGVNVCTYSCASVRWNISMYRIIYWVIYIRMQTGIMMDRLYYAYGCGLRLSLWPCTAYARLQAAPSISLLFIATYILS
jgi:hypothetical protein